MLKSLIVVVSCTSLLFSQTPKPSQQPSQQQIDEGKEYIEQNPEKAAKKLNENKALFDALSPEQQQQIMGAIQNSKLKTESDSIVMSVPDSLTDSTMMYDSILTKSDSLRDSSMIFDTLVETDTLIYGHHLFTENYNVPYFTEIPDGYVIAPGDEILLRFWGRYNQEQKYLIGKDGYVFIEPLNRQVFLPGMTYGELRAMIQRISTSSPGVQGDVKLVKTHPIFVNITGRAKRPGTFSFPAGFTFWQILMQSKGPAKTGSVRDIRVTRKGKKIASVDMYQFLHDGKEPVIALRTDDMIFFGGIQNVVSIDSLVKNPGKYELSEGEKLEDLIDYAGGFASSRFSPHILIQRVLDAKEKGVLKYARKNITVDLTGSGWEKTVLHDGDVITVKNLSPLAANTISISGPGVWAPGIYSLTNEGMTIGDLLKEAGGLKTGYHSIAELQRINPNGTRTTYPIDLDNPQAKSVALVSFDSLITFNDSLFVDTALIKTRGFVRKPIEEIYSDSLSLMDVIRRSDGTYDGALPYVYVKRTDNFGNISYIRYEISDTLTAQHTLLQKRDEVLFFNYRDFNKKLPVTVLAFNQEPLILDYSDNMTLQVIIHELNGLNPQVDSSRVEICIPDFTSEQNYVIARTYSLNEQSLNDSGIIQEGAIVFFRQDSKKETGRYVFISGEVQRPGRYALLRTDFRLSDIFTLCGGLTDRGNRFAISIIREGKQEPIPVEIIHNSDSLRFLNNWVLNQNDFISVGRNDYSVEIAGAVFDPRTVAYNNSYKWMDYIKKSAGGFTDSAKVKNTYVQYPNGITKKARDGIFSESAKIVAGCRIVVPYKPPKPPKQPGEGFDYIKFISAISSTVVTILSVLVIADRLQ